jgi:phage virion morphogenesis protein
LRNLGSPEAREMLLEAAGAILESSARGRIGETKQGPDAAPWAPWTIDYDKTREARNSLLQGEGDLHDSLGWSIGPRADFVEVGSNLPYAAIHQLGAADASPVHGIPARPYLGLSPEDSADIEAAALMRLTRLIEGRR